eukprot:TRINITY_DN13246_c0_g4_i1.p1 TRINITY_DN13246_c0_g4~~TRINITY_DN13246_c0_g4_i1.p1  ORF type:complete len:741 (+),score=137.18 TRINITY_DN13246_c0_g4_i1:34-2256(+)
MEDVGANTVNSRVLEALMEEFLSRMKSIMMDRNAHLMSELSTKLKEDINMVMEDWLHRAIKAGQHEPQRPAPTLLETKHRLLPSQGAAHSPPSPRSASFASLVKTSLSAPPLLPPLPNCLSSPSGDAGGKLDHPIGAQLSMDSSGSSGSKALSILPISGAQLSMSSYGSSGSNAFSSLPNQVDVRETNKAPRLMSRQNSLSSEASEISNYSRRAKAKRQANPTASDMRRRASTVSEESGAKASSLRAKLSLRRQASKASTKSAGRRTRSVVEEGDDEDADTNDEDGFSSSEALLYSRFQTFVLSWQFELAAAFVIVSDLVVMGLQTHYAASYLSTSVPTGLALFQKVVVPLLIIEVLMRVAAERTSFFCDRQNLGWNYFDVLIVAGAVLETSLDITDEAADTQKGALGGLGFRMIRIVRILRLIRILRVARIIRFVTPLRTLVMCITSTLKSLVWSLVLLSIIMYGMAIMFTGVCTDYRMGSYDAAGSEYILIAESTFGNLPMGILTLFGVVAGGRDWVDIATMIFAVDPWFGCVFCLYIAFCVFAVLNVMTGVFCQAAIESAQRDQDLVAEAMLVHRARDVDKLRTLFESMDTNGDGMLDLLELEDCFDNKQTKALFASLDIHLENAWQLFNLLDSEGQGEVNAMDFVDLCFKVKGPAKTIDVACLTKQNKENHRRIRQKLSEMNVVMTEQDKMMRDLWTQVVLKSNTVNQQQLHGQKSEQKTSKVLAEKPRSDESALL